MTNQTIRTALKALTFRKSDLEYKIKRSTSHTEKHMEHVEKGIVELNEVVMMKHSLNRTNYRDELEKVESAIKELSNSLPL